MYRAFPKKERGALFMQIAPQKKRELPAGLFFGVRGRPGDSCRYDA